MGFFLPMPPAAGGATEKSWHQLSLEFARRGHGVTILSRQWPGWPDRETVSGVRHLRLRGYDHTRRLGRNLWRDFRWSLRAGRALPPADLTLVNCISLPAWLGWRRGAAGKIIVMTGRMPKGQYRIYRRIDRVLAVSTPVRDAVISENPRLAPLVRVSGYPIDWRAHARPGPGRPAGSPVVIGFVGRIHPEKGLDILVAALERLAARRDLPPWRVVLCGPASVAQGGSGEAYLDGIRGRLAASIPAGSWELRPPEFGEQALVRLYRGLDIFCYPSVAERGETFGVAVAEAMAAGAVPVVSDLPCFGDFVRAGETGEIFDRAGTGAASRLAAILGDLVADPARRSRLSLAACAEVLKYDYVSYADRLLEDFAALQ
jgi:glycosyltransferase involved in cell wall biosynthesis